MDDWLDAEQELRQEASANRYSFAGIRHVRLA